MHFYHTGLFHWQGQNIARLICHKELSSTQVCCMLKVTRAGLYKALTSHKGENELEHNRNYNAVRAEAEPIVTTKIKVNTAKKTMKKKGKGTRELKPSRIVTTGAAFG